MDGKDGRWREICIYASEALARCVCEMSLVEPADGHPGYEVWIVAAYTNLDNADRVSSPSRQSDEASAH
jgi:hypothetical protein